MPRISILSVFVLGALFSIGLQTQALDTFEAEKIETKITENDTAKEEVVATETAGDFGAEVSLEKKRMGVASEDELLETTTDPIVVAIETEKPKSSGGGGGSRSTPSDDAIDADEEAPTAKPDSKENLPEKPASFATASNPADPINPADLNNDGLVNDIDLNMLVKIPYGDCVQGNTLGSMSSCWGDINLDGVISFGDLTALLSAWHDNPEPVDPEPINPADLNRDGSVGYKDIEILLKLWGTCTTPDYLVSENSSSKSNVCWGDVDGDGDVDFADLTKILSNWTEEK